MRFGMRVTARAACRLLFTDGFFDYDGQFLSDRLFVRVQMLA